MVEYHSNVCNDLTVLHCTCYVLPMPQTTCSRAERLGIQHEYRRNTCVMRKQALFHCSSPDTPQVNATIRDKNTYTIQKDI